MSKKTAVIIGVLITVLVFAAHYFYDVDYLYTHWILVIPVILFACIEGTIALYYTIGIGLVNINYILTLFIKDREKALMMVENIMLFLIVAYIVGKIIEIMKKKDEKLTAYQDLVKISSERDDRDKFYTQIAEYTSKKFLSEKSYLIFVTKDNLLDRVFSDSKDIPDKKQIEDKIRDNETLVSKVINSGETFYSNFSEIDSRFEISGKNSPKFMAVPIEVKGKNIGLITVESSDKYRNYTKEDLKNLHEYASIVGILAENMEYYKRGLYDDLLEIPGDRYIKKKIENIIEDKNKRNDLSVLHTIAMIDIDNFKKINEIYGAIGGDIILKKSVELFKETLGENDFIGRLSGNTFIIVLENKGKYITKDILEELRNRYMTTEMYIRERKVKMTFSASIISLPMDTVDSYDEARDLLEKRLFRAKLTGKNFILEY